MDKKNTQKQSVKQPMQNYVPRKECGDMTEEEAEKQYQNGGSRMIWDAESINSIYNYRK